ncbi:MAG: sigma-70 family RNA polymerase sigma factor [Blastocatellia bacterium]|nr:sigma-70 family RNA polymerase sigma factor [Blastocatellia bacterium]
MNAVSSREITGLLKAWSNGDQAALERLVPLIYDELYRLARGYMNRESPGHPLQVTALVNEAYLRLANWKEAQWENRAHFFGVAAQLMRRVLVDFARNRDYEKRGGGRRHVPLDEATALPLQRDADFLALDDALRSLSAMDPRKGHIVELKFFAGLSVEEIAAVLQTSPRTVMREWSLARAWLFRELNHKAVDER